MHEDAGFGVYVHWPFCAAKCPYCDFNSHVRHGGIDEDRFLKAYLSEIGNTAQLSPDVTVSSIFFGGGTPSLMKPDTVGAILEAIAKCWTVAGDAEVSLEANPGSAEAARFRGYRAAGVNRLSLGVQSLDDQVLSFLGRIHDSSEAVKAVALARETFPRLSFDLIYARPDHAVESWRRELTAAIDLAADHLSLYQLTIEHDTPFEKLRDAGKLAVPRDDKAAELYLTTQEICEANDLPAYETSNHATPGAECRHNLIYWRGGAYAGIGAGAHGRLNIDGMRRATATERNPEKWLELVETHGHGRTVDDELTGEEIGDEFLLMGLRLTEGVDLARYEALSGRLIDPSRCDDLIAHGMIENIWGDRVRTTRAGALVLDAVVADLAS